MLGPDPSLSKLTDDYDEEEISYMMEEARLNERQRGQRGTEPRGRSSSREREDGSGLDEYSSGDEGEEDRNYGDSPFG